MVNCCGLCLATTVMCTETPQLIDHKCMIQVGYKRMRPRTNKRSAFATKCMVLAAYLMVNMGIGCCIAITTTTWFWWVYMMMGILLFLLGVRIIIFGLSLVALVQFSRRHRRQRRAKAARAAALELKAARAGSQDSAQGLLFGQPQLSTAASAARQDSTQPLMQSAWGSFSALQRGGSQVQPVLKTEQTAGALRYAHQPLQLFPEWCQHSSATAQQPV